MPCYHPLTAWRARSGINSTTGKWSITFNRKEGYDDKEIILPCGRCIGCRLELSRQWAIRLMHESYVRDHSVFVTLTYDEEHLPPDGSLNKKDIQHFIKELRRKYGKGISYYQCGEYGDQFARPHHHAILFGVNVTDRSNRRFYRGNEYFESASLQKLWGMGYVLLSGVTFESCAYTARYCTKKITGKLADQHYGGRLPEYATMSRRNGLGKEYWNRFKSDIIVGDSIIIRKNLICKPAKYYDKLYDAVDPQSARRVKNARLKKALENQDALDYRRREVREKLQIYKFKQLKRGFENADETVCNP